MALTPKNPSVDVYSVGEIAQAAGVPVARVEALVTSGRVRSIAVSPGYFAADQAISAVRALRADGGRSAAMLFDKPEFAHASPKMPVAAAERGSRGHRRGAHFDQHHRVPAGCGNADARRTRHHEARVHCIAGTRRRRWRRRSETESSRLRARSGKASRRSTARYRFERRRSRSRRRRSPSRHRLHLRSRRSRCRRSSRRSQPSPRTKSIAPASSTNRRRKKARVADLASAAASARAAAPASAKARGRASATERAAAWAAGLIAREAASCRRGSCAR